MNLAKHRKAAKLSQTQLGKMIGVFSRQTICEWERDPGNVKLSRLEDYARACNVTLADLLGYDGQAQEKLAKVRSVVDSGWSIEEIDKNIADMY